MFAEECLQLLTPFALFSNDAMLLSHQAEDVAGVEEYSGRHLEMISGN
jgi:hypothetical protein